MHNIETARLRMRPFILDDLDPLSLIYGDADVMKYIRDGQPVSREQTEASLKSFIEEWNRHGFGLWAVLYKEDESLIGFCGLRFLDNTPEVEVGYRLAKTHWGMGLATEAARASLRYGFETLDLQRIVAVVHPQNSASQRVLEKIGLRYEKVGRYYNMDLKYYACARDEFIRDGSTYIQSMAIV